MGLRPGLSSAFPTGFDLVMVVLTQTRKPSDRRIKTYPGRLKVFSDHHVTHVYWDKMVVIQRTGAGRLLSEAMQSRSDHQNGR
jgi:hypothetical protein